MCLSVYRFVAVLYELPLSKSLYRVNVVTTMRAAGKIRKALNPVGRWQWDDSIDVPTAQLDCADDVQCRNMFLASSPVV